MTSIEESAELYSKQTIFGSRYANKMAYIQGAKDVLTELITTVNVSVDEYLKDNVKSLIEVLKGNLTIENEILDDNLGI